MPTAAKIVSDAIWTSQKLGVQVGMETSEASMTIVEELLDAATACDIISPSESIFSGEDWEIKLRVTSTEEMH